MPDEQKTNPVGDKEEPEQHFSWWKTAFESEIRGKIIALLALIVAVGSMYKTCENTSEIRSRDDAWRASENRPALKILGAPKLSVRLSGGLPSVEEYMQEYQKTGRDQFEVELGMELHLTARFSLYNAGNMQARILGSISTDTVSWAPVLREFLLNIDEKPDTILREVWDEKSIHLLPADSAEFIWEDIVHFVDSSEFIIHLLVYYESPAGAMYDTYLKAHFASSEASIGFGVGVDGEIMDMIIEVADTSFNGFPIKLLEPVHSEYGVYTKEEADRIRDWIHSRNQS